MAPAAMRTAARSLSDAKPVSFWLDDPGRPEALPALTGDEHCDLLVVGGGYSGLWTALIAKERDPERDVVLIEGHEVGWAASGRNGGFCAASSPMVSPTAWSAGRRRSTSWRSSGSATSTPSRRPSPGTRSTANSSAPARSTSPPSPTSSKSSMSGTRRPRSSASPARSSWTRTHCAPKSTHRRSWAASGTGAASPCCTPPSWPGA